MEFKKNHFKIKDKHDFDTPNLPHAHLQKRLEAFLKVSPFKKSTQIYIKPNVEKFITSLIPLITGLRFIKLSAFQALKYQTNYMNKKGILNKKNEFLNEMKEILMKIKFLKQKPCVFIQNRINEENSKILKLARVILKINNCNAFYNEKSRHFFHRWRLINFESSLRQISAEHGEIIKRQIINQINNIYLSSVKNIIKQTFDKILNFSKTQRKKHFGVNTKEKEKKFGLHILFEFLKEKTIISMFFAVSKLKNASNEKKAIIYKENMKNDNKNIVFLVLFKVLEHKLKLTISEYFHKLKLKKVIIINSKSHEIDPKLSLLILKQTFKVISQKQNFCIKSAFESISQFVDTKKLIDLEKTCILKKILDFQRRKIIIKCLRTWELIIMKARDPVIQTKRKSHINPVPATHFGQKNEENIKINRYMMINQAIVNKELEDQQKNKAAKLLILNKNLGLIEISTLISRKQRFFAKIFFNNLIILGTFEPNRYQEYEHYLKILQEEKEILHNELEEIENYNKKFSKHIDQKLYSIWGGPTSIGTAAITDEKSGQEGLMDHNSLFNEVNEEVQIRINFLEFIENQNVVLQEEVAKNEQRIKHEEDKYESDLNMLKENIRTLQTKGSINHYKTKVKKSKMSEKKMSMLKSINSYFNKKSYTHDQDESD